MSQVKAVPDGLHTMTPSLVIDGAADAIEFYKKAFGAEESGHRAMDPSGTKIWHAELRIGDSIFFVNDTSPEMNLSASHSSIWIYTEKVDAAFDRATQAGGKVVMPVSDMFWGDRTGTLTDPWGNRWTLAQHVKDMTPEQMQKGQDEFVAQQKK